MYIIWAVSLAMGCNIPRTHVCLRVFGGVGVGLIAHKIAMDTHFNLFLYKTSRLTYRNAVPIAVSVKLFLPSCFCLAVSVKLFLSSCFFQTISDGIFILQACSASFFCYVTLFLIYKSVPAGLFIIQRRQN